MYSICATLESGESNKQLIYIVAVAVIILKYTYSLLFNTEIFIILLSAPTNEENIFILFFLKYLFNTNLSIQQLRTFSGVKF